MSKRSIHKVKSTETAISRSQWLGLPVEIVEYIHSFLPFHDVNLLLRLLQVTKTYHLYLKGPYQQIYTVCTQFYQQKSSLFLSSREWRYIVPRFGTLFDDMRVSAYLQKHCETIVQDREMIHDVLHLFRVVNLMYKYKPQDENVKWPLNPSKYIPVNTQSRYIFHYDAKTDKFTNIKDALPTMKRVRNMPRQYHTKRGLRELVKACDIDVTQKDPLLSLVSKSLAEYNHCIAYMTLGKNANHGRIKENTPFKHLVVDLEDKSHTHLHIFANHWNDFRSKLFVSRFDDAHRAFIEFKVGYYPKEVLQKALQFIQ